MASCRLTRQTSPHGDPEPRHGSGGCWSSCAQVRQVGLPAPRTRACDRASCSPGAEGWPPQPLTGGAPQVCRPPAAHTPACWGLITFTTSVPVGVWWGVKVCGHHDCYPTVTGDAAGPPGPGHSASTERALTRTGANGSSPGAGPRCQRFSILLTLAAALRGGVPAAPCSRRRLGCRQVTPSSHSRQEEG